MSQSPLMIRHTTGQGFNENISYMQVLHSKASDGNSKAFPHTKVNYLSTFSMSYCTRILLFDV